MMIKKKVQKNKKRQVYHQTRKIFRRKTERIRTVIALKVKTTGIILKTYR